MRPCNFVVNRHRRLQILPDHGFGKAAKRKLPSNFRVAWVEPCVELEGSRGAREIPEEIQGLPEATVERGNLIFKPVARASQSAASLKRRCRKYNSPRPAKAAGVPRVELERLRKAFSAPASLRVSLWIVPSSSHTEGCACLYRAISTCRCEPLSSGSWRNMPRPDRSISPARPVPTPPRLTAGKWRPPAGPSAPV